jgi:hypothetical protein
MTDKDKIVAVFKRVDNTPLSDHGILHVAKAMGLKFRMTPSSARSRRAELQRAGRIVQVEQSELSSTGYKAAMFRLA